MEKGRNELEGQVALVTGASSGLGRATAVALAAAGMDVALLARGETELRRVADQIIASGRRALAIPGDLASPEEIAEAVSRTVSTFGRIDVLVNAGGTDIPGAVAELSVKEWDRVLNVNLRGPFLLARAVLPHMQREKRGTIINVSSVAGKRGWANASAYCASKFGLTGFTQALAAECKSYGIRACVLYPGGMATSWGVWSPEERIAQQRETRPPAPAKALPPEDVAALIVWIATSPPEVVLNEVIVTPIEEGGWP